ncbi:hypothetical protein GPECTOR_82g244 [Gonium pectorale]|uniref:Uncharacterized protein n=1 Tax=Gonium pectorale TaxID=33097 RepID=A0A150G318_GONPE|nr:hypothetical protein GPECTOR_82g244 [Gonium pectorale]|eukprot:KXZ43710.1 hypothetical protein GPECTOR_82g244 [Gonium pectorale]
MRGLPRHAVAMNTRTQIDAHLQKRLFKASTLYGASRELLLKENRLLRSQLEEHHITTRTSRALGPSGQAPGGGSIPESKLKQARMMQGPHMEQVARLLDATEALDQAEKAHKLPTVRHAELQVEDGSRKVIQTLEQQLATLAGQKVQLLQRVADLTEQCGVLDMKLEGAMDQVAELRRQKTEMLAHQENLSKDLREHLLSEAKRADAAEVQVAEAKQALAAARAAEEDAHARMERALAEAHAMQAALQEKSQQVDTLRGLYVELRGALEALAGDVASGQQAAARQLLDSTREQFLEQRALLEDVHTAAIGAHQAAQHQTQVVSHLDSQQRQLVTEVVRSRETATQALGAFERQLAATQHLLAQSEADRVRLARQAIAANVLNRIEDKRHEKTIKLLANEVPESVAGRLAPELRAIAEETETIADQLGQTNHTLAEAGVMVGDKGAKGMRHAPSAPDVVDDSTLRVLADAQLLRSNLHALHAGAPGVEPGHQRGMRGGVETLFRSLPPGMEPLPPATAQAPLQAGGAAPAAGGGAVPGRFEALPALDS